MPKKIECQFCAKKFGYKQIFNHYNDCIKEHIKHESGYLVLFYSYGIYGNLYYIFTIVGKKCKFKHIDEFLKKTWCECCNHQSQFCIYYNKLKIEKINLINEFAVPYGPVKNEGTDILYTYGGSTTQIRMVILSELEGQNEIDEILTLVQNPLPEIKCYKCKQIASIHYEGSPLCYYCCADNQIDAEPYGSARTEKYLKIVNSPRTGVCIYE